MALITEDQLRVITTAIIQRADPQKVILFGSQVRGTVDRDSDIDLLVIVERPFGAGRSRRRAIAEIRHSLPSIGVPIDVLLFDTHEVAKWGKTTNHIIAEALREGRILHERP